MERAGTAVVTEGGVEEGLATAELKLSEAGHPLTVRMLDFTCISWFHKYVFLGFLHLYLCPCPNISMIKRMLQKVFGELLH